MEEKLDLKKLAWNCAFGQLETLEILTSDSNFVKLLQTISTQI